MSNNCEYKVSVVGGGLTLDRQVTQAVAEQIVMLILSGRSACVVPAAPAPAPVAAPYQVLHTSTSAIAAAGPRSHDPFSVREYLDETGAKRIPDKIIAIGSYLATHHQQTEFTRSDIIAQFEGASEAVPKNLNRDLKWTLKAGWIAERSGGSSAYYVTNTGKTAIKEKFSKEVVQKTKGMTSNRLKRKGAKADDS